MSDSMKLQFDFYSKEEFAISLEGTWESFNEEESELFIFACYTLRIVYNLNKHVTCDAIAGALINHPEELLSDEPFMSSAVFLLAAVEVYRRMGKGEVISDPNIELLKVSQGLFGTFKVQAIDSQLLSTMPKIVEYRGNAKKRFVFLTPQTLDLIGWGIFSSVTADWSYYSFSSVIALYRYLGIRHAGDEKYLRMLFRVGEICARIHTDGNLQSDQAGTATFILREVIKENL
jgi:hypothetical protein